MIVKRIEKFSIYYALNKYSLLLIIIIIWDMFAIQWYHRTDNHDPFFSWHYLCLGGKQ